MGGSALKNTLTRRYKRAEYEVLTQEVLASLQQDFPTQRSAVIPAYRAKTSFGDLDILLETEGLTTELVAYIQQYFKPNELVKNGHVISFDYKQFQVDFIGSTSDNFAISLHYYAWNDLGNILGRLYHKMGFKYGYDGLSMIFKADNYQYGELCISKDIEVILAFAGLDAERFLTGFDTLEAIFQYAASSPFFNKAIYLLENRNHASRIRDKKRPTYNALLKWLETQNHLPAYPWENLQEHGGLQSKAAFMQRAFEYFPHFQMQFESKQAQFQLWQLAKEKFNGQLVQAWTGLEKQELGQFMQRVKAKGAEEFEDFTQWLAKTDLAMIKSWVIQQQ